MRTCIALIVTRIQCKISTVYDCSIPNSVKAFEMHAQRSHMTGPLTERAAS